jgi:hypothetical protein
MLEVLKRGRTHNLSIESQLELFNKMVKPILLYGSEIWGFSKNIQIYSKYFVNHRGFQPLGQCRQHIKVQKALNKYSTYLLCSLKLFLNH